jgi:hypothetical protein
MRDLEGNLIADGRNRLIVWCAMLALSEQSIDILIDGDDDGKTVTAKPKTVNPAYPIATAGLKDLC